MLVEFTMLEEVVLVDIRIPLEMYKVAETIIHMEAGMVQVMEPSTLLTAERLDMEARLIFGKKSNMNAIMDHFVGHTAFAGGNPHIIHEHEHIIHEHHPKYQVFHGENHTKKEHDVSDLFEIALTALAYLSFGMFIINVIMCISMTVCS